MKLSQNFFFFEIFDDVYRRFFVDIAEISSVNCGLYPFHNLIFQKPNSIANFEFLFSIFHEKIVLQN